MNEVDDVPAQVRSMVGHSYRIDDVYDVGAAKVSEFAKAVQNFHPAHFDIDAAKALGHPALVAPPTFMSLVAFVAQRRMFEEALNCYALPQVLQVDQRFAFHRPLQAGDRLSCEVTLVSARRASGADLMIVENDIFDQHNQPILKATTTLVASIETSMPDGFMDVVDRIMMASPPPNPPG
ncbi:MaoC family dehydratase N-terminal domain-containing protein [Rhodococcus sp. G-MC3]|uniref:FAS1-like dehydratase domain-containing protein n=1 Tax=Rhodococcus sp. G-MC3 TaxID=3046209 RepID=UPI0024B9D1B2|nr:MaoC family dehydratase N-terminal domain-containing protein [Rhodococcus sp. G-MC3]MDJ0392445.1 MaoC family dehydratase N-terminal domain-containing protein [Rhodococcus sp. G-MC3]